MDFTISYEDGPKKMPTVKGIPFHFKKIQDFESMNIFTFGLSFSRAGDSLFKCIS